MLDTKQTQKIVTSVRELNPSLAEEEITDAIRSYEDRGADGGGNKLGIWGTYIAHEVDKAHGY